MRNGRGRLVAVAALAVATSLVAACAQEPDGGGSDGDDGGGGGDVELRFAWWGNDLRNELTNEAIAAFEEENPGITVSRENADWSGYWDRLSTTAAAGDLPDVIQMDEKYLRTYADQGLLMDLYSQDALSTENIDPTVLPAGEVDGQLFALVTSVNTYSVVANADLLSQAGVEPPDDQTWTWDDLSQLSQQVTENVDDAVGMQYLGTGDSPLQVWAKQHGETLWTDEGELGASPETLASFWQYVLDLTESGAANPASTAQEQVTAGQEASGTATNQAAFGTWWSNQYRALSESSGQELLLLRPPLSAGSDDRGTYNKPSMFWSISQNTDHPEEAARFVDFLVNSEKAGDILLVERGVPSNLEIREGITDNLSPEDQEVVSFLEEVSDEVGEPPPLTPAGASDIEPLVQRITFEVLFGQITPEEAAEQFTAEAQAMVSG
ncbi:extracellular solute-binding protein [Georgenia halophila]|uniref:Extracellular solute-binding protein n=1 Tax=Georgenia halophila TaxID=620889 RepID=A0ABP8LPX6_9MICO